jgi:hypothetical protein
MDIKKDKVMEREADKRNSLDRLIDDFNKKTAEQLKDILSKIDAINSELKKVLK